MIPLHKGRDGTAHAEPGEQLVEVWGDYVDRRQVTWSVLMSMAFAGSAFFGALQLFEQWVANTTLIRTYAMLAGLLAALVSAAISARRFPPKRELVGGDVDIAQQREVLRELMQEPLGLGKISELSAGEKQELEDLGLLELFEAAEKEAATAHASPADKPSARPGCEPVQAAASQGATC